MVNVKTFPSQRNLANLSSLIFFTEVGDYRKGEILKNKCCGLNERARNVKFMQILNQLMVRRISQDFHSLLQQQSWKWEKKSWRWKTSSLFYPTLIGALHISHNTVWQDQNLTNSETFSRDLIFNTFVLPIT